MASTNRPTQVLQAASRLIAHYGFDKTTMEDIAREAGVSKGALYLLWSSKDQLFEALLGFEMRRLLDDLQARIEADPQGGSISNLYRHTLVSLRQNHLMRALYARDSRILGDFVRRQDMSRYTDRLLTGAGGIQNLQAAGLLRSDIRPQVMAYLFSIIALGFLSIGSILPENESPPLEETGEALAALLQSGFELPGGNSAQGKQTFIQMIDQMREQYNEPTGRPGSSGDSSGIRND